VLARARYSAHVTVLEEAGAHAVVDEEASVGKALGVALRRTLSERQASKVEADKPGKPAETEDATA
ncbi:hypothetical protein, partial [Burkholderia sp. SIMBA_024]|uniref:hypothetical protein n=1 Tax=Burkholderia sp. SIMBA_024 TaxID=3085768 RepID=UPI00397E268B